MFEMLVCYYRNKLILGVEKRVIINTECCRFEKKIKNWFWQLDGHFCYENICVLLRFNILLVQILPSQNYLCWFIFSIPYYLNYLVIDKLCSFLIKL